MDTTLPEKNNFHYFLGLLETNSSKLCFTTLCPRKTHKLDLASCINGRQITGVFTVDEANEPTAPVQHIKSTYYRPMDCPSAASWQRGAQRLDPADCILAVVNTSHMLPVGKRAARPCYLPKVVLF